LRFVLFTAEMNSDSENSTVVTGTSWRGEDPRAVVNWFVLQGMKEQRPFPHVSLQKILYLAHASFLHETGRPLVRTAFEAWEYGPVNRSIWVELKEFGRSPVTSLIENVDRWSGEVSQIPMPADVRVKSHLKRVFHTLKYTSPGQLIDITHRKESAWSCVWNKSKTSVTLSNHISDELSKQRFNAMGISLIAQESEADYYFETPPFKGPRP